jgi:hypothetical protein
MRSILYASIFLFVGITQATAESGGMCGGFMGAQCGKNEWCSYSADNVCGVADGTGVCKPRPEVCTKEYLPVCGCNAKTYSNACEAHADGVSVAYVGTCRESSVTRACLQVIVCGTKDGQRKEYPNPCAAEDDGATNIAPKTGPSCEATQ